MNDLFTAICAASGLGGVLPRLCGAFLAQLLFSPGSSAADVADSPCCQLVINGNWGCDGVETAAFTADKHSARRGHHQHEGDRKRPFHHLDPPASQLGRGLHPVRSRPAAMPLPPGDTRPLLRTRPALALLLCLGTQVAWAAGWKSVTVEDFGAVGDNQTDNTAAFRAALRAVVGGGEVVVPAGKAYQTGPVNLTSNVVLRVDGTMRAVMNRSAFPKIAVLPSVGHDYDTNGPCRRHPFVFAVGARNVSVVGSGTIDGAGRHWWNMTFRREDPGVGRPHLMELQNVTDAEVTGVTLLNSPFWTFHPVYCRNLHIHHIEIQIPWWAAIGRLLWSRPTHACISHLPWCARQHPRCFRGGFNGDGIDVDSCQNVLIEHNYINCGSLRFRARCTTGCHQRDCQSPSSSALAHRTPSASFSGLPHGR